jgi:Holliday junction resolvasome RuvABC ATP-dependent DNA helicase subunit
MPMQVYPGYKERTYELLKPAEVAAILDRNNPNSPFHGYIGNDNAIEQVGDVLFGGFSSPTLLVGDTFKGRSNHCLGPKSLAILGPASCGKTELARRIQRAIGLPMVECDGNTKNAEDLFRAMSETYARAMTPLVPANPGQAVLKYKAPPGIVFYDEAHTIKGDWLLRPTEPKDATLITNKAVVDVSQVLFIFCTTHRGKLNHAFDTRCLKVQLEAHSQDEVGQIVRLRYPQLPAATCTQIAAYGRCIPREALTFAEQVMLAANRRQTTNYREVCKTIAARLGIDDDGFNRQHLGVLAALYNHRSSMALKRLADQIGEAEVTLEEYVLPALTIQTKGRPPLVRVTTKGAELTEEGTAVLKKKNLIKVPGKE